VRVSSPRNADRNRGVYIVEVKHILHDNEPDGLSILYDELPKEARFDRLSTLSKHFIGTIKMVAYRAETAMAQILTQKMTRHDDARSRLRAIYNTEVDMNPDLQANTPTIRLHPPRSARRS
jgi:hypothetical protein